MCQQSPQLWGSWSIVDRVDDSVRLHGVDLNRTGIAATSEGGAAVSGSAASWCPEPSSARAFGELLERAALLDASEGSRTHFSVLDAAGRSLGVVALDEVFPASDDPTTWGHSRSNGVALAPSWREACRRSHNELVERDRILRSWFGLGPAPVAVDLRDERLARIEDYRFRACRLDAPEEPGDGPVVAAVLGFPTRAGSPLLRGFAADATLDLALARAGGECLQSLAFLCDDELPAVAPEPTPTPMFHLDHYLRPETHPTLERWLDAGHPRPSRAQMTLTTLAPVRYVDLTPPALRGRAFVARAISATAMPLTFGGGHPWLESADVVVAPHPIA
jgi:ribosomal protein S12 methylthiotransferase accessory factor YcaO